MKNQIRVYLVRAVILQLIWLCGCASVALRHDYANYSDVYGDSNNEQLLLNLARESLQQPAYFVQLASISSQYQFTTSAGFTPTATRTAPPSVTGATATMIPGLVQHTLTFGGSLNAGITQTPIFQFLPLTGSNFVQTLLSPISDKVFWTFYDQGWPADWVARTMLNSVQQEIIDSIVTNVVPCNVTNIVAGVPTITQTNRMVTETNSHVEVYFNDPTDPSYPKFLEGCNDLYNAQLYHILEVDKAGSKGSTVVYQNTNAPLKEIVNAIAAGLTVKYDTNTYTIEKHDDTLEYLIKTNEDVQVQRFYTQYLVGTNLPSVKESVTNALAFAQKFKAKKIVLTTRTVEEALNGVANEEQSFNQYEAATNLDYTNNITFRKDSCGTIATVSPANAPAFTVRPILMIQYDPGARPLLAPFVTVRHQNVDYMVADLKEDCRDPEHAYLDTFYPSRAEDAHYQNSTVFTMISYLFSQAAIDTSKLPVQQLIQVQ